MRERRQAAEHHQATDADLAGRAGRGDLAAFEELYRRHVEAAWRVALAVTANPDDAADAVSDAFTRVFQALPERLQAADYFLPYLLAAVRNAAIDVLRRGGRQQTAEIGDERDWSALGREPADVMVAGVDAALVARAFRSLPERWRSVLWLTEVERIPARDVALLLGVSPNGVAQLAVRARAGLRERYLQAHVGQSDVRMGCRDTVHRLGAYAAGGLAPRDLSKVDQHLAGCDACRTRLGELEDLAPTLRRSIVALPAALAALALGKWRLETSAATTPASTSAAVTTAGSTPVAPVAPAGAGAAGAAVPAAGGVGAGVGAAAVAVPGPLAASMASVVLFVAGVVGAGVVHHRTAPPRPAAVAAPAATFATAGVPAPRASRQAGDALGALVDGSARAAADVASLPRALTAGLAGELARLLPGARLEALAGGGVRLDTGVVAMDLTGRPGACEDSRVLGIPIACPPAKAPPAPRAPAAPTVAGDAAPGNPAGGSGAGAPPAPDMAAEAARAAADAVAVADGAVDGRDGPPDGTGLGLQP